MPGEKKDADRTKNKNANRLISANWQNDAPA